jgi:drug/metabolite transporter (DMT)-like permease
MPTTKLQAYSAGILSVFFWGTAFAVSKFITPEPLNAVVFTALQTAIGTLFFLGYLLIRKEIRPWFQVFKKNLGIFSLLGIVCYSGAYLVQYWGLGLTSAINSSIISNTQTFWVVFLNFLVFKHRPPRIFLVGCVLAFFGIFFVVYTPGVEISLGSQTFKGDIISLFAFILWGAYTSFSQPVSTREKPLYVISSIFVWASVLLIPFLFIPTGIVQIQQLSIIQWGLMFYMGICCASLTLLLWVIALSNPAIPSEYISLISMLAPVIGIVTSVVFLKEELTWYAVVGCLIIAVGVMLGNWEEFHNLFQKHSMSKNKN